MIIKAIRDVVFNDYKKTSMLIGFPTCSFKCCKEQGISTSVCQNSSIAKQKNIEIDVEEVVKRYLENPLTHAIICGGLEPLDSMCDLLDLVITLRKHTDDDIVIFTGYEEREVVVEIAALSQYKNIIIKFGRFIPNQQHKYDKVLGVSLASPNQYGKKL